MSPSPHTHHFIHGIIIIIITALSLGNCRFEGDSIVLSYLTSSRTIYSFDFLLGCRVGCGEINTLWLYVFFGFLGM
ncbi:hypothetical protein DFH09DRAFT_1173445, partial [Mycena vulgaris]